MNKEQIHCGRPTCEKEYCTCENLKPMTAEEFQESLNEWDTIFDPAEKPEYDQEQLIRFAELFLEYKLNCEK